MCSIFVSTMDNYQGDLTDIVRASSGGAYSTTTTTSSSLSKAATNNQFSHHHHWQQHHFPSDPINFSSSVLEEGTNFGDPFSTLLRDPLSTMRVPFLHELDFMPNSGNNSSPYFNNTATITAATSSAENIISTSCGALEHAAPATFGASTITNTNSATSVFAHKILEDDSIMRSSRPSSKSIFSNMIQISPNAAKLPLSQYDSTSPVMGASAMVSGNMINATNTSKDCLVDNTGGVQISSPRNPGLKRRKNQAKKVVCIPAPAAANSRQTGEVVPSDLWAWRKYGQKPIKGSPYPRGYYRCSSSKGCSARKQVERSRTDPNMLVITYTSEHNHPWPTQRNALAGSSRSQPSKNNNNNNNASTSKNSETSHKGTTTTTTTKPKDEEQESNNSEGNVSVKEEIEMEDIEKQLEMDDVEFSDGLSYKPSMLDNISNNSQSHEDFFAELGEIETDPLNLLFTQDFNDQRESKALDPFHLFDWSGRDTNNNNNSFEESSNSKRRL
ncbi:hypothetical protein Lal_00043864 [Lupinus albus]|uniref:Putative transcription factor WRKY family n=1 Tax=Lupinus albus TaxID=3870 RepID=A0A6A4PE07_LUPAL|nr:putative transcription factor WRKY family [Lupinus albus]KAF1895219.1 hypothetical protein Lal_00043864 [Lupinus albus]